LSSNPDIITSKRGFDLAESFTEDAWQGRYFVWRHNLWVWDDSQRSWNIKSKQALKGEVAKWMATRKTVKQDEDGNSTTQRFQFNARLRDDVVSFILTMNILEDDPQPPFDARTGERTLELDRCIFFRDKLYDVADGSVRDREWNQFHVSTLPFDYDPNAECPEWDATVGEMFEGSEEARELLHREIGYLLMGFRGYDSLFVHAGKPRAGKGVVDRIQGALLGESNRIAMSLSDMGDTFATQGLEYARHLVLSEYDEGKGSGNEPLRLRQLLKQIIGRDPVRVRAMYQGPQTLRCAAVPKIVGNAVPEIPDQAGSVWSKARILWFGVSHLGSEDVTLEDRLHAELPGIARRAAEAAQRLWNSGPKDRWPVQPKAEQHLKEAILMSNPVEAWLMARCTKDARSHARKAILFADYLDWCAMKGHRALSQNAWTRACKSSSFALEDSVRKYKDHEGDSVSHRVFVGLRFNPGGQDDD
jgi:P4 family phage/plasmid primase-like protien